ncbi:MAG: hypothetical protein JSS83_25735 [Cyanobacteria bacterium SZAS LIN-3]|nr:hypothetical protein [Cyanobacteria bacterium SZAS LIN-3]
MELAHLIPAYQPLPFPLPVWLMQILLILGFYLHALPMNVMLGGGFICAALFYVGRNDKSSYQFRAAKALAMSLPLFISFAITQGIVPLLFLQLIYGPAFYTSSILMAVPWISILAVVMISYYLSYIVIYRVLKNNHDEKTATRASLLLLIMSIGFALVGYIFSNNMTLMLRPEKWLALYQASPNGLNMNMGETSLIPRYLHFFVASFAVAGMTLGCFGLYMRKRDEQFSTWMVKTGSKIFLAATLVQIPVGLWFLKAIPPEYAANFLGNDMPATAVFILSMVLMLVAISASSISMSSGNKTAFLAGLVANALLILTMIINRHQLRLFYLNPHVKPDLVTVATQWDLLAIFLVSTVALIWYLTWLCKLVLGAFNKDNTNPTSSAAPST